MVSTPEESRTLIVSGGSRGIGASVARLAAARGFDVAIGYLERSGDAERVAGEVARAGRRALPIRVDVAREDSVVHLFEEAARQLGPIAALVTSAGVTGGFFRVSELTADTLAKVLAVNVTGTVLCAREAIRRMSTASGGGGGAIVTVSSIAAQLGGAGDGFTMQHRRASSRPSPSGSRERWRPRESA